MVGLGSSKSTSPRGRYSVRMTFTRTRQVITAILALSLAGCGVHSIPKRATRPPVLATQPVPSLTGPVVDQANLLDDRSRAALARLSLAAWRQNPGARVHLQYLLISSLNNESIESFSARVFDAWRLGSQERNNGVLVVVAVQDRKTRIAVGSGIDDLLTSTEAAHILQDIVAPAFRRQDYGRGLLAAGERILTVLGALP
jgi:uncharacterized protein